MVDELATERANASTGSAAIGKVLYWIDGVQNIGREDLHKASRPIGKSIFGLEFQKRGLCM
jgi:hypothetical protein